MGANGSTAQPARGSVIDSKDPGQAFAHLEHKFRAANAQLFASHDEFVAMPDDGVKALTGMMRAVMENQIAIMGGLMCLTHDLHERQRVKLATVSELPPWKRG